MDIVLKQQSSPLLFCPSAKFENKEDEFRAINFGELLTLSNAEYDTSSLSSSSHLRPLDWYIYDGDNKYPCAFCFNRNVVGTKLYFCKICRSKSTPSDFHKECIEISKHPYHPKHSLRLIRSSWGEDFLKSICLCCSKLIFSWLYSCSICDFTICPDCTRKPPLFEIDHPKRHEHTLFYFPKNGLLICDVCALNDHMSLMFLCRQCDFVVHKECAYFPCIIRISRHEHRLAFISSLTPQKWLCGACRGKIDTNYGRYACVKGCSYGVHSKCAIREWDGRELKGIPEDAYEDIKPFNEISDGIIQHFSHQNHHMRLDEETSREFDENKRCQACTHPICDDIIYNCMQCDFIFHQECANLPRKKHHAVHPHPLTLEVVHRDILLNCTSCYLKTNGFVYLCFERDCHFILDVCCASIAEPLDHRYHPHPLFLTYSLLPDRCSICDEFHKHQLHCGECGFILCFRCATLPSKLRYKHDKHFLLFSYDKDANGQYLCEVCEKEATPKNGIYTCNDCNVIVHIECLLGENMHLIPGRVIDIELYGKNINILLNNHLNRKICRKCHNRCQGTIVFKVSDDELLCSYHCLHFYC